MKRIFFLLTLSVVNFSEVTLASEAQQQQQPQNVVKFDKTSILEKLESLGIDTKEMSYAELLKDKVSKQKVSEKVKELERRFDSIMRRIRAEQADYENKNAMQLREIINEGIDQAIQLLGTKDSRKVFDKIRTVCR